MQSVWPGKEAIRQPRVMGLGVHAYISGVPHRIASLESILDYMQRKKGVWFATGEEIYEWYRAGPRVRNRPRRPAEGA